MATASKTPKSTTPRKRTPKAASTNAASTASEAHADPAAAKPAAKARPKRAPKAAAPATKVQKKKSGIGKAGIAAIAATGIGAVGALAFGLLRNRKPADTAPGTVPTDLMGESHPDGSERAIEDFRPDPSAPVPESERDALRPALAGGSAPTLVAGQADELRRFDAAPS